MANSLATLILFFERNVRACSKIVRRMHGVGLVHHSLQCECELGVFFVHKKSGNIRLILDCRRANARFRAPPGTELLSSEGFRTLSLMAQEVKRQTSNSSASTLEWGTWPTASTECASREVSGGFSVGQASRPPVWAFKRSMGNVLNPSAEFGPWLTAYLWVGAGACTLHRKPTFDESAPSACCQSRFASDRGQPAVLKPRSKGVTSHNVYVDNFGILGGASCEGRP